MTGDPQPVHSGYYTITAAWATAADWLGGVALEGGQGLGLRVGLQMGIGLSFNPLVQSTLHIPAFVV